MRFVAFDVKPCRRGSENFEVCEPGEADLWVIFGRKENGVLVRITGHVNKSDAEKYARLYADEPFHVDSTAYNESIVTTFDHKGDISGHEVTGCMDIEDARFFARCLNAIHLANEMMNERFITDDRGAPGNDLHAKIREILRNAEI